MYNIDIVAFMENPDKTRNNILVKEGKENHQNRLFSTMGTYF